MKKNIFIPVIFILSLISIIILANSIYSVSSNFDQSRNVKKCSLLNYEESKLLHPKNFTSLNLEIEFDKIRNWRKENISALAKAEQNKKESGYFRRFYSDRKRIDAKIILKLNNELSCSIKARVRSHGDLEDHQSTFLPSLNVNLTDGHIYGITKFKLFIPETRRRDNELFAANFFKEIGMLSPRTSKALVKFFDKEKIFIFQESIAKEFIENNNKREFPLYSGDERFVFFDNAAINRGGRFANYKLSNGNFVKNDKSKKIISEYGLSILNKINFFNDSEFYPDSIDLSELSKRIYDKDLFIDFDIFSSLMFAMNSHHNLSKGNLRLYFNKENNVFHAIYYDGDVELGKENYYLRQNCYNEKKDTNCHVLKSSILGAKKAIDLIDKLDRDNFKKKLLNYNFGRDELDLEVKKIKIDSLDEIVDQIKENLTRLATIEIKKNERIVKTNLLKDPSITLLDNNKKIINPEARRLVFSKNDFKDLISCNVFNEECTNFNLEKKKINRLLSQNLKIKKNKVDVNLNYTSRTNNGNNSIWFHEYYKKNNSKKKKVKINNDFYFMSIGQIDFQVDKKNRKITFLKKDLNSKIIFENSKVENWEIIFNDSSLNSSDVQSSMDTYGYTGCLNFFDTTLKNVMIKFSDSKCEDAVNFVRSEGNVEKIEIVNSAFDGIDADFSKIKFNNVLVKKSGNDCLDFSYGMYLLKNSDIFSCGDKGISVGESSFLKIENTIIKNSETGIAAKDFAEVEIKNGKIFNTKYCFQAYNKKQEFSGGLIKIENSKCNKTNQFILNKDKNSKIIYKNEF